MPLSSLFADFAAPLARRIYWERSLCKCVSVAIFLMFGINNCDAQTFMDSGTIRTVAGPLTIEKNASTRTDAVTFRVLLGGRDFDKLYGLNPIYYPDSGMSDGLNGRMLMEDFVGGASATPVILMYDFREKPPQILQITDKLDVDEVRWRPGGVLLDANHQWYIYRRGKLSKMDSMSR